MPFQWGFCFAPSHLRGEGRDEEWFNSTLNAANLTPALSLKRRWGKAKPNDLLYPNIASSTGNRKGAISDVMIPHITTASELKAPS